MRARRQRLLERLQWWEQRRSEMLVPMAAAGFGVGFGVGYLARELLGLPQLVPFLCGVATLLLSGRVVDGYFSAAKLKLFDARIEAIERRERKKKSVLTRG